MTALDDDIRTLLREALRDEPATLTALEVAHRSIDVPLHAGAETRRLPRPQRRTPRRWVAAVVAIAAVTVVVFGLIAIGTNRNESIGNDPARLHWLLRDLPSGWKPTSVFDSTTAPPRQVSQDPMYIYGTDAEPLGPSLTVQGTTDTTQGFDLGSYSANALGYEEFDLDGKRAAFVTFADDLRGLYVEVDSVWAYLSSRGLSDDELRDLGRTLAPDVTGYFDVASSALPDGMHKIVRADIEHADFISIFYSPSIADGSNLQFGVGLALTTAVGHGIAGFDFSPASIGDTPGFLGSLTSQNAAPLTTSWIVLWRRDGLDYSLFGQGLTSDQMLAAAASASQASPDEWADVIRTNSVDPTDTVPTGTAPPLAPVDTEPSFTGEPRDVATSVQVEDVTPNEQLWSGVLPTGESWDARITRVYDKLDIRYSIDGSLTQGSFGTSTDQATGDGQVISCNPIAMTKNPDAAALRVLRSNGDRYTIPLHELPGTDGVRIALIAIPDEVLLTELVDTNGNVLESYAPH